MPRRSNFRQFSLHFRECLWSVRFRGISSVLWIVLIVSGDVRVFDTRKMLTEKLHNCNGFFTMHRHPAYLKFWQRIFDTITRHFKIQTSDMGALPGRASSARLLGIIQGGAQQSYIWEASPSKSNPLPVYLRQWEQFFGLPVVNREYDFDWAEYQHQNQLICRRAAVNNLYFVYCLYS